MKEIILSADGDSMVYLVPDAVADNLSEYCVEFCDNWLWKSPNAERFRVGLGICYTEKDFIDYLNQYIFPEQKSMFVENLGWTELGKNIPMKYKHCPYYNF